MDEDPFSTILENSSIHQLLKAAREEASLSKPSRPFTPLHDRSLFQHEIVARPSSAYSVPKLVRRTTLERCQPIQEFAHNLHLERKLSSSPTPPTTRPSSAYNNGQAEVLTLDDGDKSVSEASLEDDDEVLVPIPPAERTNLTCNLKKSSWRLEFDQMCDTLWAFSAGQEEQYWELAPEVERMATDVLTRNDTSPEILLRAVLSLLELTDARVLFRYCGVALKLLMADGAVAQVSAAGIQSAFLNIMKALFKFSKVEGNDTHFVSLLPVLVQLVDGAHFLPFSCSNALGPHDDKEALVFLVGALKNASLTSDQVKSDISLLGAIPRLLALCGEEDIRSTGELQVLIQVTGMLRNLSSTPEQAQQFLDHNGLAALTRISELYADHRELLLNISRVLSKFSLHPSIVQHLQDSDESAVYIQRISRMLSQHSEYAPLCLRLMFFLGNVTAKSERVRALFMGDTDGMTLIPSLLNTYWKMDRQLAGVGQPSLEVEDVLTKVIRLVANLAISPSVGATLAATSAFVEPLLDILGCKKIRQSEELVLNAVGCATNLLFYDIPSNLLYLPENKELLCRLFRPLLLEAYNSEAVMEAARALGNLSRHESTRIHIRELRIDEILGILLEHDDRDIVYYACGVLVNLASDICCTKRLTSCSVPSKLVLLLEEVSWDDIGLNLCILKIFTNLLLDPSTTWDPDVLSHLHNYLGERRAAKDLATSEEDNTKTATLYRLVDSLLGKLPTPRYCCAEGDCGRIFGTGDELHQHCLRRHPHLLEIK